LSNLLKHADICVDRKKVLYNKTYCCGLIGNSYGQNRSPDTTRITDAAKSEAESIIKAAKEKSGEIFASAKEKGYSEGYGNAEREARQDIKHEFESALEEIQNFAKSLDGYRDEFIAQNESDIINLALSVAEKVIGQRLSRDDSAFLALFEKAVKDLTARKWLSLSVSGHSLDFVTSNSDYLLKMVEGAERLEVSVIEGAPNGTLIVETADKIVDASVETQIGLIKKEVLKLKS
jgi:flagellar assembly protein FliH